MEKGIVYLEDILDSMNRIARYIKGFGFEHFATNEMVIDAVVRNLEIIGEASRKVPQKLREKHKKIPWVEMTATGQFMTEEYAHIDLMALWDIIILLLGQLRPYIFAAIEEEERGSTEE